MPVRAALGLLQVGHALRLSDQLQHYLLGQQIIGYQRISFDLGKRAFEIQHFLALTKPVWPWNVSLVQTSGKMAKICRGLFPCDIRCLYNTFRVWWEQRISDIKACNRVPGMIESSLETTVLQSWIWCLGHLLRMPIQRLPLCTFFALPKPGWKKDRGCQIMIWGRRMKKLPECVSRVGPSRSSSRDSKNQEDRWLVSLLSVAQSRNQLRLCICFCCNHQKWQIKNKMCAQQSHQKLLYHVLFGTRPEIRQAWKIYEHKNCETKKNNASK